jgi:hypothetical protein
MRALSRGRRYPDGGGSAGRANGTTEQQNTRRDTHSISEADESICVESQNASFGITAVSYCQSSIGNRLHSCQVLLRGEWGREPPEKLVVAAE